MLKTLHTIVTAWCLRLSAIYSSSRGGDVQRAGMPSDSRSPDAEGSCETKGYADTRGRRLGDGHEADEDDGKVYLFRPHFHVKDFIYVCLPLI